MFPLIPALILAGAGTAAVIQKRRAERQTGVMTPARQVVYETALNEVQEPDKLRDLAKAFRAEGLTEQAAMLEKRAALRELPQETKKARREVFKKALESKDKANVRKVAAVFHGEGCSGAAAELYRYADGLPD
jgi:hypothetical protein